jgi:hypothetical protein
MALLKSPLGGLNPGEKRPEGYGILFIQAAAGSSDLWTVWYEEE